MSESTSSSDTPSRDANVTVRCQLCGGPVPPGRHKAILLTSPSPDGVSAPASVARRRVCASPSPLTAGGHRVRLPDV